MRPSGRGSTSRVWRSRNSGHSFRIDMGRPHQQHKQKTHQSLDIVRRSRNSGHNFNIEVGRLRRRRAIRNHKKRSMREKEARGSECKQIRARRVGTGTGCGRLHEEARNEARGASAKRNGEAKTARLEKGAKAGGLQAGAQGGGVEAKNTGVQRRRGKRAEEAWGRRRRVRSGTNRSKPRGGWGQQARFDERQHSGPYR